jgi:hypothetical protein
MNIAFLVLGFVHGVRGKLTDDVLETAVDPIFTGHQSHTQCKNPKTRKQNNTTK